MIRDQLLQKGFFPEVLPPCFDSTDLKRAFHGLHGALRDNRFKNGRMSDYVKYSGTKHDGNRRLYATPNPISYYYVCDFIGRRWKTFEKHYRASSLSLSNPRFGEPDGDRSIIISPLSEVVDSVSKKISYSPYLLKTDIAQFFPSIYTHIIPWVAHGIARSKSDRNRTSRYNAFNELDWCVQQCQNGQTRGVIVGPDAFRLIAEFIAVKIDEELSRKASSKVVGGVRHVDDYFIGVQSEIDATIVLSELRDALQTYELQINDTKTNIISALTPINDVWAQDLRQKTADVSVWNPVDFTAVLDNATEVSNRIGSESPIKLVVRRMDVGKIYASSQWEKYEPILQRLLYHYTHCIDYICLLLAKRCAVEGGIDKKSWSSAIEQLIDRHIRFNHHHEVAWLFWALVVCELPVAKELVQRIAKFKNSHILSMLIAAYQEGKISYDPKIPFENKISSSDHNWLHHLVARSTNYKKSSFSGGLISEFEHLSSKNIRLIDFNKHMSLVAKKNESAISRTKYGYDDEDYGELDEIDFDEEIGF